MAGLRFLFSEVGQETDAMAHLARPFLDRDSRDSLNGYARQLETIRASRIYAPQRWEIPEVEPVLTKPSEGEYEPDAKGGLHVFASISSLWEIQPIEPVKRSRPPQQFELVGIASTKVRLVAINPQTAEEEEMAMWRMEVGDDNAPGCHFHVQVLGEAASPPFPKSLPVPRLPNQIFTPASVFEFVLAELFQSRWRKGLQHGSVHLERWRPIQRRWLDRLLCWQRRALDLGGSPWTDYKGEKPPATLFLPEEPRKAGALFRT